MFLAIVIGFFSRTYISHGKKVIVLICAIIAFYSWSSAFVTAYEQKPNEHVYVIAGWEFTGVANKYLATEPTLDELSARIRNNALLKAFGNNPDLVWEGGGLTLARIVGGLLMALVLFCLGVVLPGKQSSA